MTTTTWTSAIWGTAAFRAELRDFVSGAVGEPDRIELVAHRPWSAVWRVTAAGRTSYAKQNCPGQAHEARLQVELARWVPSYVAPVLAADPVRDLLLTADLGPTLAARGGIADIATWCRIVRTGAELQRLLVPRAAGLGLTRMLPTDATTYVADAVGRLGALPPGDPRRLAPAAAAHLEVLLPAVDRWADQVDDLGLPLTLLHNDLHAANVVAGPDGLRLLDFADAVLGDPLAALTVPLTMAQRELGLAPDDRGLRRIADAAIDVWTDIAPAPALRAVLPAALQLGRLAKVESWRRCVATMTPGERLVDGAAPAERLARLLEPTPITPAAPLG
ncbi:aminoglycoside phosphotransferase family protein [Pimelobacter simplex]|uniref:aminoglycoside phosphotransferase family protein n=1 Tax=Nocardioides simplex TaxID=2045 RepID=UPI00214FDB22|nr:aminoglycoside phosphotransferase family protein [Pimelobacter simplex]UUW89069.1 aminoglycoside phosphotransferase family protein [Pimelobacter simplex]UUW98573.1 aminoglycoside phosphotransferase family protein [Pimelobacter simplex]